MTHDFKFPGINPALNSAYIILRLFAVLSVAQGELDVSAPRLRRQQKDPRHEVDPSGECSLVHSSILEYYPRF